MRSDYFSLMAKALSAYSREHIEEYFSRVRQEGLTEHGFPRLTANIGILLAHGMVPELKELFLEMMDFCCTHIPNHKAANDFSVREIVCCILEVEKNNTVPPERSKVWRDSLATIRVETTYNVIARTPDHRVFNWAAFSMVSEWFRAYAGISTVDMEFIDTQLESQLYWMDENGMYRDPNQPMVYDLVPRGLFALLLHFGYQGKFRDTVDALLKKSGYLTLKMQSVTGELAYGGRSNQFIHNEAWICLIMENEANRYARAGDLSTAGLFKYRAKLAMANAAANFAKTPIHHVKNRFPLSSGYGCEKYAYFDKYMITAASFFYAASLLCDESIPAAETDTLAYSTWQTSPDFHRLFLRSGSYFAQYDTAANVEYDSSGLGRLHRAGAPSELFLSLPCTSEPHFKVDTDTPIDLALAPGVRTGDGKWLFASDKSVKHEVISHRIEDKSAVSEILCTFPDGRKITAVYTLNEDGLKVVYCGSGDIACQIPAFDFNGEEHTVIKADDTSLTVAFGGWQSRTTVTGGKLTDSGAIGRNRNGHYREYIAAGQETIALHIELCQ